MSESGPIRNETALAWPAGMGTVLPKNTYLFALGKTLWIGNSQQRIMLLPPCVLLQKQQLPVWNGIDLSIRRTVWI